MPSTAPRPLTPERRRARSLAFRRWRDKQGALGLVRLRVFVPAVDAVRLRSTLEARTAAFLAEREERILDQAGVAGDTMETIDTVNAAAEPDTIDTAAADAS